MRPEPMQPMVSPPRIRNWLGYDLAFRNYLDDVAFK
jgi:hypothetical protein